MVRQIRISKLTITCFILSLSVLVSCFDNKGNFFLINKTRNTISRGQIIVCKQTIELKDIKPNHSASGSFKVKADSHYNIRIEFDNGKHLETEAGYVTNGLDFHHVFIVTETGIEFMEAVD